MVPNSSVEDLENDEENMDIAFIAEADTIQVYDIGEPPESDEESLDASTDMDENLHADLKTNDDPIDQASSVFNEHHAAVYALAIHPTDPRYVLSGGGDDRALLWNLENQQIMHQFQGHSDSVVAVGFSFDGKYIATGGYDNIIKIWNANDGFLFRNLEGPTQEIEWMQWHQKGYVIIAGSSDATIWMWLVTTGDCMHVFAGHEDSVTCGTFTGSGKMVLSGSADATVRLWNPKSGECSHVFRGNEFHAGPICCIVCHPFLPVAVSGSQDGTARLLHLINKRVLAVFSHDSSPDRTIASNDEEEIIRNSVECAGFCHSMKWLATGCLGGTLRIWDLDTLQCRQLCRHDGGVIKLLWDPNEPIVYTSTVTALVCKWDARSGALLRYWSGHRDMILDMAFIKDQGRVVGCVTASEDESVRTFSFDGVGD